MTLAENWRGPKQSTYRWSRRRVQWCCAACRCLCIEQVLLAFRARHEWWTRFPSILNISVLNYFFRPCPNIHQLACSAVWVDCWDNNVGIVSELDYIKVYQLYGYLAPAPSLMSHHYTNTHTHGHSLGTFIIEECALWNNSSGSGTVMKRADSWPRIFTFPLFIGPIAILMALACWFCPCTSNARHIAPAGVQRASHSAVYTDGRHSCGCCLPRVAAMLRSWGRNSVCLSVRPSHACFVTEL